MRVVHACTVCVCVLMYICRQYVHVVCLCVRELTPTQSGDLVADVVQLRSRQEKRDSIVDKV